MTAARKAAKQGKPAASASRNTRADVAVHSPGTRKAGSEVLASVHATVAGLRRAGVVKAATMREFDALCLAPVVALAPAEIAALRRREHVSQPVFARYLNVSKSSVSQWEIGEKKPDGAALKLLDLVRRKGLAALL